MTYKLRCLLCEAGTTWNLPKGTSDLVAIQEHLMRDHGVPQEDLQRQTCQVLAPNTYLYVLPDGRFWLYATKE